MCRLFGRSNDEIIGKPVNEVRGETRTEQKFREREEREEKLKLVELHFRRFMGGPNTRLMDYYGLEHGEQLTNYDMDCQRHGDFLALILTRLGNEKPADRKHISAINLGQTKRITLTLGSHHDTDKRLVLSYYPSRSEAEKLPEQIASELVSAYLSIPRDKLVRPFFGNPRAEEDYVEKRLDRYAFGDVPHFVVEGIARPSADDMISFEGIETNLLVPHGKGQSVYSKIMAAVGQGWEWNP